MKNLIVMVCLMVAPFAATFSKMPYAVFAINTIDIVMNADLLIATSNNPNDPLVKVEVFNGAGQKVAQGGCSSTKCTLNLSSLPTGNYLAKATSLMGFYTEPIYVP